MNISLYLIKRLKRIKIACGEILMDEKLLFIILTLKRQTKIAEDDILFYFFFTFYLSKKIRLDFSCESSA